MKRMFLNMALVVVLVLATFFRPSEAEAQTAPPCTGTMCPPPLPTLGTSGGSVDPNDKVGSHGVAEARFLAGEEPLRYVVFFENLETATLPAQEVVVTDLLDASKIDFSTFSLGPMGFGDKKVVPPPGLTDFVRDVDLRPDKNLIVRIEAHLDKNTGLLTWRFTSIDPLTGQPTTDPLAGFLPPNLMPPEGEGSVLFTVKPKQGVVTGTQICNQAAIVFDVNLLINTPEWCNALDNTPPQSRVLPLAATQTSPSFLVRWSATDVGSGISSFNILVSENRGPLTPFISSTTDTSATFTGQPDRTYAFCSLAQDLTRNVEGKDLSGCAEATTTIATDSTPPVITLDVPAPSGAGWHTGDVTLTWGVSDAESGIASSTGCDPVTLIADTAGTTLTCSATNGASLAASESVTIRIDQTPPTIIGLRSPNPNAYAWNNSPVTITYECSDALSGLAAGSPPVPTIVSTQGAGQSVTGTCTDLAGNSAPLTVQDINIDMTLPQIAFSASSSTLWPPNGKLVANVFSGEMTDGLSGIDLGSTSFRVIDEYGMIQPSGPITVMPDGSFSFTPMLQASRLGNDHDGRHYQVIVSLRDKSGNPASVSTVVVVPHDQGK